MKVKWNNAAFRELRTAPEVEAYVDRLAHRLADACGEGFEVLPAEPSRNRAHRVVSAETVEARYKNATQNTLIRNLPYGA